MAVYKVTSSPGKKLEPQDLDPVDFLANVSHEIRNPLTAIIGLSHLLKGSPSPEEQEEYVDGLVQTSETLLEIVNNLMDFSKLGAGRLVIKEAPSDLKTLVTRGLYGQKLMAEANNLEFLIDLDPQIPSRLLLDGVKINQVLVNLVSNALKFTAEGAVTVKVEVLERNTSEVTLAFAVKDTGLGISQEHLGNIFKAFDQGNEEINAQYGGTGLGLTICKNVIEMMGGCLEVESELGQGTEFRFALSFEEVPEELSAETLPDPQLSWEGQRVLVVDDNKLNRLVACRTLEKWKMQTETASNGVEALQRIQASEFDLVLMDLKMPIMDGAEATRLIRQLDGGKYQDLPIIALTGSMVGQDQERLEEIGFTNFLVKPFLPEDLIKVMASCTCCC